MKCRCRSSGCSCSAPDDDRLSVDAPLVVLAVAEAGGVDFDDVGLPAELAQERVAVGDERLDGRLPSDDVMEVLGVEEDESAPSQFRTHSAKMAQNAARLMEEPPRWVPR